MTNRDDVLKSCHPDSEFPFPPEEYAGRLTRIRARMASDGIDTLFLMAPESMNYVSGYQCELNRPGIVGGSNS